MVAASTLYALSRIAIGAALTARPRAARPWLGSVVEHPDSHGALRVLGVRDALLGAAVLATTNPTDRRRALLLCAAADAADALQSTADARRTQRPGARAAAATATAGMAIGLFTAVRQPG